MKLSSVFYCVLILGVSAISAEVTRKISSAGGETRAPKSSLPAAADNNGAIVSTMLYYLGNQKYSLQLCAMDYKTSNYIFIQELIPSSLQLEVVGYTGYDEATRTVSVMADNYPSVASGTFWVSTLNEFVNATTPVRSAISIPYPVSSSPYPLDVAQLEVSRFLTVAGGRIVVIFTNGEVHEVDLVNKRFNLLYNLISADKQLSPSFPSFFHGHTYDASRDLIWSIVEVDNDFFSMSSSVTLGKVSNWVQMSLPDNILPIVEFSAESVINIHAVVPEEGAAVQILVVIASVVNNAGFDMILFLDTETGQLDDRPSGNLIMTSDLMFLCDSTNLHDCDFWQTSAWDPVLKTLYFQAHYIDPSSAEPFTYMNYLTFDNNKKTGNLSWYFNKFEEVPYGLQAFQFVPFI
jgi:hypothetical protein